MTKRISIRGATLFLLCALCSCRPGSGSRTVSGTIETDQVQVASRYGGRVEQIFAQEGDSLKSGQRVAALSAVELSARREQLAARVAELEAGPRKEEIEAAKAEWEAQSADLEQAQADARRAEGLFAQRTVSVTERDQALTRAQSLEKSAAAARSRYELLRAGTRPEQLAQARAQLAEVDAQLAEMNVVAPSDSMLEVLSVKVGDVLAPNQPVATLLLPSQIWVRVYVPETWLGHIRVGEAVQVRVDAFPAKGFGGTVEQMGRQAEFTPRNVQTVGERIKQVFGIKVRLDNASGDLRAGMAADVIFPDVPG